MGKRPTCSNCGLSGEHEKDADCIAALRKRVSAQASALKKLKGESALNDLNGAEWLFATNTWWETNFPIDPSHKLRSKLGSVKPPGVGFELARTFTRKGQVVADTFAGTGGLLFGADMAGRVALGCELNIEMVSVIEQVRAQYGYSGSSIGKRADCENSFRLRVDCNDCLSWMREIPNEELHFLMIDPPYGVAHKKNIEEGSFALDDLEPSTGWGRLPSFEDFLEHMRLWALEARRILKRNRYIAVFISDRYVHGQYYGLGDKVRDALTSGGFVPKATRVWRNAQSESRLKPYAIGSVYVPNIRHQYVHILRKE